MKVLNAIAGLVLALMLLAGSTHAAPPRQANTAGCLTLQPSGADDSAALATFAAALRLTHCGRLGAGIYHTRTVDAPALLIDSPHTTLTGAGAGRTILQYTDDLAIGQGGHYTTGIWISADDVTVSDLSIANGAGMHGPGDWLGIQASNARRARIERTEVTGMYGSGGAGGNGIGVYLPGDQDGGWAAATLADNYIHDGAGQGLGIAANGNRITGNRVERVGHTPQQHCVYLQGGDNDLSGNTFRQCGAFAVHAFYDIEGLDPSGNRITGNYSENPGEGHVWVQNDGAAARDVTISGNTFVDSGTNAAYGIITYVPALILGNTFTDVQRGDVGAISTAVEASGTVISGNRVQVLAPRSGGPQIFVRSPDTTVTGNSAVVGPSQQAIRTEGPNTQISGNVAQLVGAGSEGIRVAADGARLDGNTITAEPGAGAGVHFQGAPQAADVSGNRITTQGATWTLYWDDPAHSGARVHHNGLWGRLDQSGPGLVFGENDGP